MLSRKFLGLTTLAPLSFGLMAGCSDDSTNTSPTEYSNDNVCVYDGYTATEGSNGETLCIDEAGNTGFWINADGSYDFPEASEIADSIRVLQEAQKASQDSANTGSTNDSTVTGETPVNSSSSTNNGENTASSNSSQNNSSELEEHEAEGPVPTITYAASGASITNDNGCVTLNGGEVVITCAGDYDFSGSYSGSDAQIRVYTPKSDSAVYLNLRGLTLTNTDDAVIYTQMASKTFVVAKKGSTNTLSDGSLRTKTFTYTNANNESKTDTTVACIYSKDDLTIKGEGTLIVKGNYNNGIHSTNDLRFRGETTVNITAKNNGLKGKGSVTIEKGFVTITTTDGDGIKSDECTIQNNDTTIVEGKGYVSITGGTLDITSGDDGIQAFNYVLIADSVSKPTIKITSKNKGIVSDNTVNVNEGTLEIVSQDDGIHSNRDVNMIGGNVTITGTVESGCRNENHSAYYCADGIHADSTLQIIGGIINVKNAYEGFEGTYINATGGVTAVYTTDDGWNAAGGADGSGFGWAPGQGGGFSGGGFGPGGSSSNAKLIVTGGFHYVKTGSGDVDGFDSNGELAITGGVVVVECQISGGQGGSFDSDGSANINNKTLLGFSSQTSEKGTNNSVSFSTDKYYGTSSIAFKPTITGSVIVADEKPSVISNVDGYKSQEFPNGLVVYYK